MKELLEQIVRKVKQNENVGLNPLVFLDNSAVIDFEHYVKNQRLGNSKYCVHEVFTCLTSYFPIFVTDNIFIEICCHHTNHKINGKPEVGTQTVQFTKKKHEDYQIFLASNLNENSFLYDKIRYDVYWTSLNIFNSHHKKRELDPMSLNDRELVSGAIFARYSNYNSIPVSSSFVISADSHILESLRLLTDEDNDFKSNNGEFGYNHVYTINPRELK